VSSGDVGRCRAISVALLVRDAVGRVEDEQAHVAALDRLERPPNHQRLEGGIATAADAGRTPHAGGVEKEVPLSIHLDILLDDDAG